MARDLKSLLPSILFGKSARFAPVGLAARRPALGTSPVRSEKEVSPTSSLHHWSRCSFDHFQILATKFTNMPIMLGLGTKATA
jgi:hypothetical protein